MIDFLVSGALFSFVLFALLPLLCLKFIVTRFFQSIWFCFISLLHPDLEFIRTTTVRTLLDTHRNQGIGAVLLCVKGPAQPEAVKRHLQELVNRRSKNGNLAFPRLRDALVIRCGTYAWQKVQFDLQKNVTVVPGMFKKRAITEFNIQEYVNDLITKFLPQNASPWHIIIIPTMENHHYILLKLHHILLTESLNIADLLPLIPPTRHSSSLFTSKSPLVKVLEELKSFPLLKQRLTDELSNYWNEFLSNYDPLERLELLKNNPNFSQFLAISLITFITILKEIKRGFKVIKPDVYSRYQYICYIVEKETRKRQIHFSTFLTSIIVSLDPRNLIKTNFKLFWNFLTFFTIRFPSQILAEVLSVYQCIFQGYCSYTYTFVGLIYTYVPLAYGSFKEFLDIAKTIFYAPKNIISQILCKKEYLQTVTLTGRKCVAWSEPIKTERLKMISKTLEISELELLLGGLSMNLSKYLNQVDHVIPDEMAISMRNINSNYIFATGINVRPEDSCSGILFMGLPIPNNERGDTPVKNLAKIKNNFKESLEKQQVSYFLSILQTRFGVLAKILPSTFLAIYLRYLSRKFAVTVTEVSSRYPNVTQRTLWGQEVSTVIYWRPPQANTCISLCLNEYADHIKLGVMCDARLIPNHNLLASNFSNHIEELSKAGSL
ncbi:hypothetical protein HHI36_015120 [Cryptolaemus montrouzieri]|uniref:O-acyltransferase WSD1 C-terminal domain-containing protein n=1 Tax=Cryptolaemus montrouzieri TaxID=559131 RepID=A0ABD2N4N8_9CUCU